MKSEHFSNSTRSSKSLIALLAGAAFVTTIGLTGFGVPTRAYADAVKVEAPAQLGFADVVEKVSPAVVSVRVKGNLQPVSDDMGDGMQGDGGQGLDQLPENSPLRKFFRDFGGPDGNGKGKGRDFGNRQHRQPRSMSQGSGFFISEDGFVVTNNHVVDDGAEYVVVLKDGTELNAKLIGKDKRTDLAVLKVDAADRKFTYVDFAADKSTRVGDWVVAVGNPFGLGGTVTAGIVSALGRDIGAGPYDDFIQIDAAVNHGNSGGPAFNQNGQVVGINTAIFSPSGGNVGIAFAIPASTAKVVVDELMHGGIKRGWLGVQIQPVSVDIADSLGLKGSKGALVNDVQPNSPALKAGVKTGDVILSVGGNVIEDPKDLARKVAAIVPGTASDMVVWRNGAETTLSVSIEKLNDAVPAKAEAPALPDASQDLTNFGIKVTPNEKGVGVVVMDVDPDSVAAERGLTAGDIIVGVNDAPVASADDFGKAVATAATKGRKSVLVQIQGENGVRFLALPVAKG